MYLFYITHIYDIIIIITYKGRGRNGVNFHTAQRSRYNACEKWRISVMVDIIWQIYYKRMYTSSYLYRLSISTIHIGIGIGIGTFCDASRITSTTLFSKVYLNHQRAIIRWLDSTRFDSTRGANKREIKNDTIPKEI